MENQRATYYRQSSKSTRVKCEEEEVTINVGVAKVTDSGQLKPVKGKLLPMKMKRSMTADSILQTATQKQQAHNGIGSGPFKLLYPNNVEVKTLLESEEAFSLEGYKLDIGKPYSRINLYLVHILDFIKFHSSLDCTSDDRSDSSDEKGDRERTFMGALHGDEGSLNLENKITLYRQITS